MSHLNTSNKKFIIGIAGRKGAGKDLLAMHTYGLSPNYSTARYALADSLKMEIASLFNVNVERIEQYKNNPLMRFILQQVGTEYFRKKYGDDVWIKKLLEQCNHINNVTHIIVPDIRFPNEAQWAADNGILFYIDRPCMEVGDTHASESLTKQQAVHNYGAIVIENTGSLDEFKEKALTAYNHYLAHTYDDHSKGGTPD